MTNNGLVFVTNGIGIASNRLTSQATPEGTLTYLYDAAGDVKTVQNTRSCEVREE